jgi:curved DNA-binding protein CbpA
MPAKEKIPDYYEILGIDCDASADSIKKAYRSLAKAFHPDTSTHPNARERFEKINEAYEVLSDSAKREEYDSTCNSAASEMPEITSEDKDEFSIMADYEFYSDENEDFLINGQKKTFENARHIIVKDTEYIIDGDEMIDIGGIERFTYQGLEKYLIDGTEYRIFNAEHYYQGGCEYVIIEDKPYKVKSS